MADNTTRLTPEQIKQIEPAIKSLNLGRKLLEVYVNANNEIVQAIAGPLPPAGLRILKRG